MATFEITTPDGRTFQIDGETREGALNALRQHLGQQQPAEPERGVVGRTIDWLSGANRRQDIPQAAAARLGLSPSQSAQMTGLLATTASDDRLQQGIMKIVPEAQFDKDEFGNLIAIIPTRNEQGEVTGRTRFYPNPRGLDTADLMQGAGALALGTGIGKAAQVLGLPTAGLLGGATIGGTEAALVEGASSRLTDQPFKIGDIPMGAAGGAAGAKIGQAVQGLVRRFQTAPNQILDEAGDFLPEVKAELQRAGIDPATVRRQFVEQFRTMTRQAVDPQEAARIAQSQSLPEAIPLTRGQVTGSKGQQLFEDMALSGGYGEPAERMLQSQRQAQQSAIRSNIPAIQSQIAGEAPFVSQFGVGGQMAQDALVKQRRAASQEATRLYGVARASGPASLGPEVAADFADEARSVLRNYTPASRPVTTELADQFDEIMAQNGDIPRLFQWREQVTNAAQGGGTDAAAARSLRDTFDSQMTRAVDQALLQGDDTAISKWMDAISNYRDFASKWKSKGGALSTLTNVTTRDGNRVLSVAPEAASNYIFGASGSKIIGAPQLARDLRVLKDTLPANEWNALRQEGFMNLAQRGEGAFQGGERMFSGVKFKKTWEDMLSRNSPVVRELFSDDEIKLITQFADVAARATGGAVNSSNSANAAAGMLQRLAGAIGGTNFMQFATRLAGANMLRNAYGGTRAFQSLQQLSTAPRAAANIAGAAGAAMSGETVQNPAFEQIERTTGFNFGPR